MYDLKNMAMMIYYHTGMMDYRYRAYWPGIWVINHRISEDLHPLSLAKCLNSQFQPLRSLQIESSEKSVETLERKIVMEVFTALESHVEQMDTTFSKKICY